MLVPWAACLSPACEAAMPELDSRDQAGRLPHLRDLLNRLTAAQWLRSDEYALIAPHELLWAQAQGWPVDTLPTASVPTGAWLAQRAGLTGGAWGLITPCHWAMGHDSLTMLSPQDLQLSADDSRALFESARGWFESDGWPLHWVSPLQWLTSHPSLTDLPAASLDRVIGRNPDVWLPSDPRVKHIRRLQAEVQMLWYQHPVNEQREKCGLAAVNSFWLSGCGALPAPPTAKDAPALLCVDDQLQQALMRMDIPTWLNAWEALDSGLLAEACQAMQQGKTVRLSLCGERHAVTLSLPPRASGWQRLLQGLRRSPQPSLSAILLSL